MDGELYYVHYDITGKLRKKEEVRYCLGVVQNATVYHYGFHKEKYNSYYENGKPAGIWVDERENGTYRLNFNDKSVCFENSQTGFVEIVRRSLDIFTPEIRPFKNGFSSDAYRDRIGNFGVGDRYEMVLYGGEKPVINQFVGDCSGIGFMEGENL
ncbi:MAG: hypothetical protein J6K31_02880 [Parabacteroides sp.]|nr:hypothetical protein [Parabacteroides sp.]